MWGSGAGGDWCPLPSHQNKNDLRGKLFSLFPSRNWVRYSSRKTCSLLQLLSELHSWGENSNLLPGPRAPGFSKLHLMTSGSWKGEGNMERRTEWGEGRGTLNIYWCNQLPSESELPASQLTIREHSFSARCSRVRS